MSTLADRLAAWASGLTYEDLSERVVHQAKARVLDSIGTLLGGWRSEPASIARAVALETPGDATVLGTARKTRPELAAFANGAAVRYLDYNDTYLSLEPAHPSDNIPACWAAAERAGSSGKDLLTAIVIAYEIQCRLCDAASLRAHGWDHVVYGAFSSTLGAARLLGLDARQSVHAMSIAAVSTIATRQTRTGELSMWKACAFSNVARAGVFAALLAQRGMTGPEQIFEGPKGVFAQLTKQSFAVSLAKGPDDFMLPVTYIKYWPAEYHSQSAIDAAIQLRGNWQSPDEIESIDIETFEASHSIIGSEREKWRPTSRETADHSLPYCVAVALIDGNVTVASFEPSRFRDPAVLRLLDRTKVLHNPELDAGYPKGIPNLLRIKLKDGRTVEKRVDFPPGHAGNPLSDEEIEKKFRRLATDAVSGRVADQIIDACWRLDKLERLDTLLSWKVDE